jgi:hypothetical protein
MCFLPISIERLLAGGIAKVFIPRFESRQPIYPEYRLKVRYQEDAFRWFFSSEIPTLTTSGTFELKKFFSADPPTPLVLRLLMNASFCVTPTLDECS